MKLIKIAAISMMTFASTAAMACDPVDAEERWLAGEEAGLTLGVGTVQDAPSFAVDTSVWNQADYNTRLGMVKTFECLIAGPDSVLGKAHVITPGGKILAVWDGVSQDLEIR